MQVTKAVITAAGRRGGEYAASDTVLKAMLPMVDRDGRVKPVIEIIAEEALDSGIEEICLVTAPGDEAFFRQRFGEMGSGGGTGRGFQRRLHFAVQEKPEGYGHAVWCARQFVGSDPFLLLVSDHLYISGEQRRCARQVIDLAVQMDAPVAGVQATREHLIHHYGTIAGKRLPGQANLFQIEQVVEKPTPSLAEQKLHVPGLRVGHYLCFFGMHVLTPTVLDILDTHVRADTRDAGEIQLTPALQELARREKYLAVQTNGRRYNIGIKYGVLEAQIALAMAGQDRDEILGRMLELFLQVNR